MRGETVAYSKRKRRLQKQEIDQLNKTSETLEEQIDASQDPSVIEQYKVAKSELESIVRNRTNGS